MTYDQSPNWFKNAVYSKTHVVDVIEFYAHLGFCSIEHADFEDDAKVSCDNCYTSRFCFEKCKSLQKNARKFEFSNTKIADGLEA